jgi:CRISPR-associated protein Cas1
MPPPEVTAQSERGDVEPEALTIDALHQFAYCPRRAYLMHSDGLMAHNAFTLDGKRVHRRVDRVDQALEERGSQKGQQDAAAGVGEDEPLIARSVTLMSERLRLVGKLDLVSTDGDEAVPVEIKRGQVPQTPERSHEPERVQLMAQAMLLRDHGFRVDYGFLYFAGSRTKVRVDLDAELEARTLSFLERAHAQQARGELPPPLEDSPKCKHCSVAGICLPDETLALRDVPRDPAAPEVRRLYPASSDARPLYIQHQGAWVGTRDGTLTVKTESGPAITARLKDLDHLVLCGAVQISAQAIHRLCESGIPICHLSSGHWFYGYTTGFVLRNAYDRAAQYRAADDPQRCLQWAKAVVFAKGMNQRTQLRRNARDIGKDTLREMKSLVAAVDGCRDAEGLLGVEGNLARVYFANFKRMVRQDVLGAMFDDSGRRRRPPPDPVNALLSFGYALLSKDCTVALTAVGLDPFWGLYHRPRHGRPALALDLMEEFRPIVVDSAVITAINTGMVSREDFIVGRNGCLLKPEARKSFIVAYESRMEQMITHPTLGYQVSWRTAIRLQGRLFGRWLRGDIARYPGITTR